MSKPTSSKSETDKNKPRRISNTRQYEYGKTAAAAVRTQEDSQPISDAESFYDFDSATRTPTPPTPPHNHMIFSEAKYIVAAEALLGIKRGPRKPAEELVVPVARKPAVEAIPDRADVETEATVLESDHGTESETETETEIESDNWQNSPVLLGVRTGLIQNEPTEPIQYISKLTAPSERPPDTGIPNAMMYYCFDTIIAKLNHLPLPRGLNLPTRQMALFVKWTKGAKQTLRGCMGSFHPFLLREALQKYAISSATKDSRFPPILLKEIKDLNITVSLVRTFEEAMNHLDWELGAHGIYIRFTLKELAEAVTASFLPEVPVMRGWTKEEAIDSLIRKAGYEEKITPKFRTQVEVRRFETDEFTASYRDYKAANRIPSLKVVMKK